MYHNEPLAIGNEIYNLLQTGSQPLVGETAGRENLASALQSQPQRKSAGGTIHDVWHGSTELVVVAASY